MNKSTWNYRVISNYGQLTIHSAYYAGATEPHSWSETPAIVTGESVEELQAELTRFNDALSKPVLAHDQAPPSALVAFAAQARALVALLTQSAALDERSVVALLARVYALAFALPELPPSTDREPEEVPLNIPSTFGLSIQLYATANGLEPLANTTCGDLDDDLHDIAKDLGNGLAAFDRGDTQHAAWLWKFSFESHWGTHAVEALRVLHHFQAL